MQSALCITWKQYDKEFPVSEIVLEVVCATDERITTREQTADYFKTNIISLISSTLKAGTTFDTKIATQSINLIDEEYYVVGISFYKLWRYIITRRDCK